MRECLLGQLNNYFTEMCSGSQAGSYLRLIDFVYHSTLGVRVIKKKKKTKLSGSGRFRCGAGWSECSPGLGGNGRVARRRIASPILPLALHKAY